MKSPRTRPLRKASPDDARKPPGVARATRQRRGTTTGAPANARVERDRSPGVHAASDPASHPRAQTHADTWRLMAQMREANERLIVEAVRAQKSSDDAHTETAQAMHSVDVLLNELQSLNERLVAGAEYAHAMAAEARAHEEESRRLSSRLLVVQDEERRRLALDLHDSTGQRLAALAMLLGTFEQSAGALNAKSRRAIAESRSLVDQCVREVRTLAYLLHPPMLDELGLGSAVRWYVEGFAQRSGIRVVVELADVGRLSSHTETALFRIVQESLTNVHRHASASTASIRLVETAGVVELEIRDRGRGLRDNVTHEDGPRPETLGVGIQGMRERVRQLGGTFDVEFTDTGTTVCVGIPLNTDTP